MTDYAIHRNPHPMRDSLPLLPMSQEDARFWNILHSRRAASLEADPSNSRSVEAAKTGGTQ